MTGRHSVQNLNDQERFLFHGRDLLSIFQYILKVFFTNDHVIMKDWTKSCGTGTSEGVYIFVMLEFIERM